MQAVANQNRRTSTKDMNICGDCVHRKNVWGNNCCTKNGRRELDHMDMIQYSPCEYFEPKQAEDDIEQARRLS